MKYWSNLYCYPHVCPCNYRIGGKLLWENLFICTRSVDQASGQIEVSISFVFSMCRSSLVVAMCVHHNHNGRQDLCWFSLVYILTSDLSPQLIDWFLFHGWARSERCFDASSLLRKKVEQRIRHPHFRYWLRNERVANGFVWGIMGNIYVYGLFDHWVQSPH